jgi:hypothetical protein
MSRHVLIGSILTLVTTLVFYFVNCAGGLPDNLSQQSSTEGPLSISVSPPQITTAQPASARATGGTPPYSFSVVQGTAQIDSEGTITQAAVGNVQVKVVDANSGTASASLTVAAVQAPAPSPAPAPAPAPPPAIVCNGAQPGLFQQGTLTTMVPGTTEAECLASCAARGVGVCDWRSVVAPLCYWTPASNVSLTTATPYWTLYTCH